MKNKRSAFTLAEVLMTLMILGVVATITIPVLRENVDKSSWTNGLKVAKGNIESAFSNMLADYSADSLSDTPIWANGEIKHQAGDACTGSHDEAIYDISSLQKYLKVNSIENNIPPYQTYNLNGAVQNFQSNNNGKTFNLANNSTIYISIDDANGVQESSTAVDCGNIICTEYAKVYIDVNGRKGPNTFGKDIYSFVLSEHGRLIPYGSEALYKLNNTPTWQTSCAGKHPGSEWNSEACTARVIEEGYKIDY